MRSILVGRKKGSRLSESHRMKVSKSLIGNRRRLGYETSEVTKEKIRLATKGISKPMSLEHRLALRVSHRTGAVSECRLAAVRRFTSNPDYRARMSEIVKERYRKHPEKHPNRILARRGRISYNQKKLHEEICKFGYPVKLEYSVRTRRSTRYIDIAIPELNWGFESDSKYWHKNPRKDLLRDLELVEAGWIIWHYLGIDVIRIAANPEQVKRMLAEEGHL